MGEKSFETINNLSKEFSDVSRGSGRVSFMVGYTATPGNVRIHEEFLRFSFDSCNNEYLAAIGKLLEYKQIFEYLLDLNQRLGFVEAELKALSESKCKCEKEEKKEEVVKTF